MRNLSVLSFFLLPAAVFAGPPGDGFSGPRLIEGARSKPAAKTAAIRSANIRVDVNMALVPVTVLDRAGRNVTGLERGNFRVFDGSQQVPIVTFGQQDQPVSVGLVYDCSRSMRVKFTTARQAPAALFQRLNPSDESFLVTVSSRPVLRQPYTSNFADLENALLFTQPNGTTSLIDGVYMGLMELKKAHTPRKALVIVSDGGDNDSRYSMRELEKMAVESDTQIFAIGLFDSPQTQEELDGPSLLANLCRKTGGIDFAIRNLNDMGTAMAQIGVTLHNQYVLGYYPPETAPSGKYRPIKVQVSVPAGLPKLVVFARSGYYVPEHPAAGAIPAGR
jgi:Ca-activated chloride channel family protein